MTALSNEEFAKRAILLAGSAERFQPTTTYDPDGDCIDFLARPDPFYAERVDDLVTAYYSQETGELVGSLLKGVLAFCKKMSETMPAFEVVIRDGRVQLVHIFRASLECPEGDPKDMRSQTYAQLIEVAESMKAEAQMCTY